MVCKSYGKCAERCPARPTECDVCHRMTNAHEPRCPSQDKVVRDMVAGQMRDGTFKWMG